MAYKTKAIYFLSGLLRMGLLGPAPSYRAAQQEVVHRTRSLLSQDPPTALTMPLHLPAQALCREEERANTEPDVGVHACNPTLEAEAGDLP